MHTTPSIYYHLWPTRHSAARGCIAPHPLALPLKPLLQQTKQHR